MLPFNTSKFGEYSHCSQCVCLNTRNNQLWGFGRSVILSMDSGAASKNLEFSHLRHREIAFLKLTFKHEINDYQRNFQAKHIFARLLVSVFSLGFAKQHTSINEIDATLKSMYGEKAQ